MSSYPKQLLAVIVPAGISVEQVLKGGNLLLAFFAGVLAVIAGYWAYRKQRTQAEKAEIELAEAEARYQRELDRDSRPPV